jgi:glutamate:Na+ symporter, ESS family
LFEEAGVVGAASIALAAAMAGIVCGGVIGGPICTWLIRRNNLSVPGLSAAASETTTEPQARRGKLAEFIEGTTDGSLGPAPGIEDLEPEGVAPLKNLVAILVAMWVGSWVASGFT